MTFLSSTFHDIYDRKIVHIFCALNVSHSLIIWLSYGKEHTKLSGLQYEDPYTQRKRVLKQCPPPPGPSEEYLRIFLTYSKGHSFLLNNHVYGKKSALSKRVPHRGTKLRTGKWCP